MSALETSVPIPLDLRKQQILKAVVADYTRTGVPVGSHALAVHLATWSSATIRNELANLVDVGYLLQPHTSAGRVPSDLGYRYYVDFLMEEEAVPVAVRRQMDPFFSHAAAGLEETLEVAARALALATDAVSMVTAPRALGARLKHLDLISLEPQHALLLIVLDGNLIRQQPVALGRPTEQIELSALAQRLNAALCGGLACEVATMGPPAEEADAPMWSMAVTAISAIMESVDAGQDTLVVHDGVRNLLHQPEFGDVGRFQEVLDLLEEERVLGEMLAAIESDHGTRIMIGRETGLEQLRQCSLVMTTYRVGTQRWGTLGVLGPTRMQYSQVAPRVRYVATRVGDSLSRMLG
ncbi:MAG: heat-inducible transcription repressor HrcA [Candidatus Dormibacteraeota bacterium]|uniref:Heat-inducible transcription repressor HrcA n=1 Tax=Candidatus Amunia macphersoniae TaxID=3127014 RepID=A0A934KQL3_9BACT|nr:heat-inducible transcription repressor HrcA [Candidatus Dormibacteraeota bacterium]